MARLLLEQVVFLATASDKEVHPDVAVAQLEALTFGVRSLRDGERAALYETMQAMLVELEGGGPAHDALQEFAEMLDD